ncbi:serine hydrolase domain-containing protein [uncultured Dokdonia sp.]|uniref:serine hydrolase domain-containing protein n=1 Tax=uncultured Dokdonia sp. TaxID=575653 RepID=UPI0026193F78|nr:serine hydrolase domain-containing protein [uncultured Dokdonia sp.]
MNVRVIILIFFFIISTSAKSQQEVQLTKEQKIKLDSITLRDVPKGGPGIATGMVSNGTIIYEKYAGYATIKDSIDIQSNSRFNIASNGKQFTALAILSLIDDQKISLEDDIRIYFPSLYPKIDKKIKIKHLLNHTSGIRDVYDLWSLQGITWWKHTFTNDDVLELLHKQQELNFEPGSKYLYSNSNYILLAEIISKIAGTSFIDYTKTMFDDLGMLNTSFEPDYKTIKRPIANPYFNFDTWSTYNWIWNAYGDGNLFSTLEDQLRWEQILQTKKNKRFSKELLEQSQSLIPNTSHKEYGYGLEFGEHRDIPYKFHLGATGAWKAVTARFDHFSIVTMINSGKIDPTGQTLLMADIALNIPLDAKTTYRITPEKTGPYLTIKDITGIYQTKNGYIFEFIEREGDLFLLRSGRNDMKLLREADNIFQQWNDAPFKQEFIKNEKGEMQITAYYTNTEPFTLTRIDSDFTGFDFTALNGTFINPETNVSFKIEHDTKTTYTIKSGKKKMKAILLTPTELLINDYEYRLKIHKDKKEKVQEMFLNSGRIQQVRFIKK